MALPILDGNQSATTLSTILTSGQHIPAHTVVSLGTQAITDMRSAVSGSVVSISNFPTTQPISGTVTIGNSVTAANISLLNASVATDGVADGTLNFFKIGGHQSGANQTAHIVHVSAGGSMSVDATDSVVSISNFPATQPVSIASVTVGNSVTIGSLPAISGTVTANVPVLTVATQGAFALASPIQTAIGVFNTNNGEQVLGVYGVEENEGEGFSAFVSVRNPISGTVTIGSALPAGTNRIGVVTIGAGTVTLGAGTAQIGSVTASISGTVPVSISSVTVGNSVTIGSLPAISGAVTVNLTDSAFTIQGGIASDGGGSQPNNGVQLGYFDADADEYRYVQANQGLPITGEVTANASKGSLTTRFGSVTTANTAFETSAVTNSSRKYLLIQNITTASNVITVGIGFTPTTTQGIQLFAGAGIAFEGNFIPTGSVNLLSSVTASCFTILEA